MMMDSLIAEEKRMISRVSKLASRFLALVCVVLIPLALGAQAPANPVAKAPAEAAASKWDIFVGYSFFAPNASVYGWNQNGTYQSSGVSFKTEKVGSAESVTRCRTVDDRQCPLSLILNQLEVLLRRIGRKVTKHVYRALDLGERTLQLVQQAGAEQGYRRRLLM